MPGTRITFLDGQAGQPQALERVIAHVRRQLDGPVGDRLRGVRRPLLAGIGASYAALALPVEVLRGHGVPAQRVLASEIEEGLGGFDTDLLIGVSQSGRSSETIAAFRAARGVPTLAVLNVTPSPSAPSPDSPSTSATSRTPAPRPSASPVRSSPST